MATRLRAVSYGGGQQSGLRPGTVPTALCVGFGVACQILRAQGAIERQRVEGLRSRLIASLLDAIPDASLNGPLTTRHPGNANLRIPGIDATDLIQRLQPNIALSSGSACHSGSDQPSHVLRAMGLTNPEARESVRLGIGRCTTDADISFALELIVAAIRLRPGAALDSAGVEAYLNDRVARYKVPSHVWFVDQFPLTPSGKIQKFVMRDQFLALHPELVVAKA